MGFVPLSNATFVGILFYCILPYLPYSLYFIANILHVDNTRNRESGIGTRRDAAVHAVMPGSTRQLMYLIPASYVVYPLCTPEGNDSTIHALGNPIFI